MTKDTMKWWGWGVDGKNEFSDIERPYLWPWAKEVCQIKQERHTPPIDRKKIQLPPLNINQDFMEELQKKLRADQFSTDEEVRLCHSYGKSYRDLLRMRHGIVNTSPDVVIYPESTSDVEFIISAAAKFNVCVIPYGGGTNIVGGVEPRQNNQRMVATLHMGTMKRLLNLDIKSQIATFEVGILGPALEEQLNSLGFSLGHTPDSFEFSSLGGWIATRSAGQQSDAYGKIEDMVVSLKMVTPAGVLVTQPFPAFSMGPNLNHFAVGSEGTLGIITEATMKVHPVPQNKEYYGFILHSFEDGVNAIYEMVHSDYRPSMIRLLDEGDTTLSMHTGHKASFFKNLSQQAKKYYLTKILGYRKPCLLLIGFEGNAEKVKANSQHCFHLCKKYKAIFAGESVGKKWRNSRFDIPYIRDYVMNKGMMVDVAETATLWSNLIPLYQKVKQAIQSAFDRLGVLGFVGCHISHTYSSGACLYFTYACPQIEGQEFAQYNLIKGSATEAIVKNGGALSHHHAVGYEHQPWLNQTIGAVGMTTLTGVKKTLDPSNISNPGKLMQSSPITSITGLLPEDIHR